MKLDFTDYTFTIPVSIDCPERLENLELVVNYLKQHLDTNIIIGELFTNKCYILNDSNVLIIKFNYNSDFFHRTKLLNDLLYMSNTKYVVNYDSDVLLSLNQLNETKKLLEEQKYDIVYPYNGVFYDVNRSYIGEIQNTGSVDFLHKLKHPIRHHSSLGGVIFGNKNKLLRCGGENENFRSWGYEDDERYYRYDMYKYKIARASGGLVHIKHPKGKDSCKSNPYYARNRIELELVKSMCEKELYDYVKTWKRMWWSCNMNYNDVTMCIPVKIDFPERLRNLKLSVDYLINNINVNIYIHELYTNTPMVTYTNDHVFVSNEVSTLDYFPKMKLVNHIVNNINSDIICIYDSDSILPINQYVESINLIRSNVYDIVIPYDGTCYNVPEVQLPILDRVVNDPGYLNKLDLTTCQKRRHNSIGGAVFFRRDVFLKGGMGNERFKSWGGEDDELIHRFIKLGYRLHRLPGTYYHIPHPRNTYSSIQNPYYKDNKIELERVSHMTKEELERDVKTWDWIYT
jgi:hypothetical protein